MPTYKLQNCKKIKKLFQRKKKTFSKKEKNLFSKTLEKPQNFFSISFVSLQKPQKLFKKPPELSK